MSNRNFDNSVIIKRLQNQVYARNLYLNNTNGKTVINNPQNSNGDSSQFTSYVPGAQTEYFRGLIGEGETISVGGIVNIPPFPTTPILQPSPVIYNFVTNGLTLYYNFGDSTSYPGSGTSVNDLSPNGYTGTLVNGPTFDSVLNGGILILDGISEYINTNNSIASNSFTINAWFKATTNVTVPRMLISKETIPGSPWNYRLYLNNSNGNLIGDIAQAGDSASIGYSQNLADNTWHLATFSRDETTDKLKLYVDGVLVSELTAGLTGDITNSQDVWIGRSAFDPIFQGGSYPFSGSLGSAFIYNRALTDDEVFTNFMATKTRFEQASGIESFTTVGTTSWTAPTGVTSVQYLVVGGGGGSGGGFDTGGGGGGGGGMVLTGTILVTPGSTYTVTVGDGGAGGISIRSPVSETDGSSGDNSVFDSIIALGGSGGYASRRAPGGGSVGGVAATNPSIASGGGNGGGNAGDGNGAGGGGGGSSGNGSNGVLNTGGNGGSGTTNSITGTAVIYGVGGGGADGNSNNSAVSGIVNTGNGARGGGAASFADENGAKGGSGIVILKY
jgi:hypothetical protein